MFMRVPNDSAITFSFQQSFDYRNYSVKLPVVLTTRGIT